MPTDQDPPTVLLSRRRRRRATLWFWLSLLTLATVGGVSLNQTVTSAWTQLVGLGAMSVFVLSIVTWLDANFAISESWARRRREAQQLAILRAQTDVHLAAVDEHQEQDDHDDRQHTLELAQANRIKSQMKRGV